MSLQQGGLVALGRQTDAGPPFVEAAEVGDGRSSIRPSRSQYCVPYA
ncbi:hypothetical protein ACFWOJ_31560 [Streptomyces sp. NPDC058439]